MNKLNAKPDYSRAIYKGSTNKLGSNLLWWGLIPILAILFSLSAIFFLSSYLPPKLPLFFSLTWGDAELVNKTQLLIIPASITALMLFNLIIFWRLNENYLLLRRILIFTGLLTTAIIMISFAKMILIFI